MDSKTTIIGLLPLDGFALMSYASVVEPLRAANLLAGGATNKDQCFQLRHFAIGGTQVVSSSGAIVQADSGLGQISDLDLLIVIAGGDPIRTEIGPTAAWLRRLDRLGVPLGGVSGGPVILARAGLMRNRRMTVHWEHATELAEMVPELLIERSLYEIDRNRITCAGGTAPLDLMHALIRERLGHEIARRISDWFMHTDIRASAEPQRSGIGERYGTSEPKVIATIGVMEQHIADPLGLDQIALVIGIGTRQLARLFQRDFGLSVMRFYRQLRLAKAANLLTRSQMNISDIAASTGFSSQSHFNVAFGQHYQSPPQRYRRNQSPPLVG